MTATAPEPLSSKPISGWGRYPTLDSTATPLTAHLADSPALQSERYPTIARGNGRSYGDSSLNEHHVTTLAYNRIIHFDSDTGVITVQAGVLLSDILARVVPSGWFLAVVPGTQFVTTGGAVAADIHGKNHCHEGCFSQHVRKLTLLTTHGDVVVCSHNQHRELFLATCGGMGLTGIILDIELSLCRISSSTLTVTTVKTNNFKETFEAFESLHQASYSVAWLDCLSRSPACGRGVLTFGEFNTDEQFSILTPRSLSLPFTLASPLLNRRTMRAFNSVYYTKARDQQVQPNVNLHSFFFPLDSASHWNRVYGKAGFIQYQFVLPLCDSYTGIQEILSTISSSGFAPFLAVLKRFGAENANYLSFPLEGYSLALDFKYHSGLLVFLDKLDDIVQRYSGRVYLAKDARLSQRAFNAGYPDADEFRALRESHWLQDVYSSVQSQRLGL